MKKLILSLIALSFASITAQAAETLKFHNLGFSTDGKYYSYATSAVGDGSGYGYANVFIKQVNENDRGEIVTVRRDTEVYNDRLALKLAIQSVNFASFGGLIPYGIRGETLTPKADREITLNTYNAKYHFELKTLPARFPNPTCKNAWDIESTRLALTMTKTNSKGVSETQILFNDYSEPGARICAQNYKIAKVIRNDDKLMLVVSYDSPGFEGMDHDFVVLSAKLN